MLGMLGLRGVRLPADGAVQACTLSGASVARCEAGALWRRVKCRRVRKGQKCQNSPIEGDMLLLLLKEMEGQGASNVA